jgi:pyrroloquinoline quinone biosynthesis protein B
MTGGETIVLGADLALTPFLVPHRAELTETVGFRLDGPRFSAVYLPDIDAWELWDAPGESPGTSLRRLIRSVDALWLDGTFFDDGELPHRDLREIPHPRITETVRLIEDLPVQDRRKVRFTHLNHTNPVLEPSTPAAAKVHAAGCRIGEEGERFEL